MKKKNKNMSISRDSTINKQTNEQMHENKQFFFQKLSHTILNSKEKLEQNEVFVSICLLF